MRRSAPAHFDIYREKSSEFFWPLVDLEVGDRPAGVSAIRLKIDARILGGGPVIRKLEGMPDGVLGFQAQGKLTAADYKSVLEPELEAAHQEGKKVRVVFAFTGDFDGMEAGAMWQDLKTGIRDWNAWERIALVTKHSWMRDGLKLLAWAVPGEVKAFGEDELDAAVAWASAD